MNPPDRVPPMPFQAEDRAAASRSSKNGMVTPSAADAFERYRVLISLHDFNILESEVVDPTISCIFGGLLYDGLDSVRAEFERAWNSLPDESYTMSDAKWILSSEDIAVALFSYRYEGTDRAGKPVAGEGRGTNIYRRRPSGWRLVHEHLTSAA